MENGSFYQPTQQELPFDANSFHNRNNNQQKTPSQSHQPPVSYTSHQNKNRSNSSSPDNNMNRPAYHSFERSQPPSSMGNKNQRKPSINDARSTMDSILRGQAKFAADERVYQTS